MSTRTKKAGDRRKRRSAVTPGPELILKHSPEDWAGFPPAVRSLVRARQVYKAKRVRNKGRIIIRHKRGAVPEDAG